MPIGMEIINGKMRITHQNGRIVSHSLLDLERFKSFHQKRLDWHQDQMRQVDTLIKAVKDSKKG